MRRGFPVTLAVLSACVIGGGCQSPGLPQRLGPDPTRDVSAWKVESRIELLRIIARSWRGSAVDRCLSWECVRYDHTFAAFEPGFTIRHHGFVVLHPDSPALTINVEYRQYYGRMAQPLSVEALEKEVEPFHRSLEFRALGGASAVLGSRPPVS
jgi:hypothetical protein